MAGLPGSALVYGGTGCAANQYPTPLPTGNWIAVADGGTAAAQCPYLQRAQVAADARRQGARDRPQRDGRRAGADRRDDRRGGHDPGGRGHAGRRQRDQGRDRRRPEDRQLAKHPSHPGIRDGDLENGIIAHEYAHGLSSRLTGGVGNSCLGGNEQAGEGWSDYIALTLLLDPALDNPDQPRGMGPYALFQPDRHGAGIRPRPYSRDMNIQPFTYDSIKTNGWLNNTSLALPHGLGHGWASVLWDMNWDLIDKYGFNRDLYAAWNTGGNNRAFQYVVDGLKMQGCNPTLVDGRNGDPRGRRVPQQRRRRHVHACGRRSPAAASATAPSRGPGTATTTTRRSTRTRTACAGSRG